MEGRSQRVVQIYAQRLKLGDPKRSEGRHERAFGLISACAGKLIRWSSTEAAVSRQSAVLVTSLRTAAFGGTQVRRDTVKRDERDTVCG